MQFLRLNYFALVFGYSSRRPYARIFMMQEDSWDYEGRAEGEGMLKKWFFRVKRGIRRENMA